MVRRLAGLTVLAIGISGLLAISRPLAAQEATPVPTSVVVAPGAPVAGLTQHGVSLHDAIKAMPFPVLEIHMSNIAAREEWRTHSIISPAVKATIQGLGWRSYTAGLRAIVELAQEIKAT